MNNTNNSELHIALNDLYACVVKVISLSAPELLNSDMQTKKLLAQISNVMNRGIAEPSTLNTSSAIHTEEICTKHSNGSIVQTPSISLQNTSEERVHKCDRYATVPELEDSEGTYYFRRTVEYKQEDERYFVIHEFTDGNCFFEIKDDVVGEKLQTFIDNKEITMDSSVVKYSGNPTANSRIVTVTQGTARRNGRSIKIITPLIIRFE